MSRTRPAEKQQEETNRQLQSVLRFTQMQYVSQQYTIFNFLKSKTFLKVLFALNPVTKDLE